MFLSANRQVLYQTGMASLQQAVKEKINYIRTVEINNKLSSYPTQYSAHTMLEIFLEKTVANFL